MNQIKLPRRKRGENSPPVTSAQLAEFVSAYIDAGGTIQKGSMKHANGAYRSTIVSGTSKKGK